MSHDALGPALAQALVGEQLPIDPGDPLAGLASAGWDRDALHRHADRVRSAGGVWPHPVAEELRLRVGSARLLAAVQAAQTALGLLGTPARPAAARPLTADERRLLADVPPHHGS